MSSIFEMVTGNVVHELSRKGDLIPVDSLIDANKFNCCSLVYKRRSLFSFFKPQYWTTGLTVDDLLEASDELDCVRTEAKKKNQFSIESNMEKKMSITLNVPKDTNLDKKDDSSIKHDLKIQCYEISQATKDSLSHRKLKTEQPSEVKALKERGENLYMVIQTVETIEEQEVQGKYSEDVWFNFLKKIDANINIRESSAITIPSKSVLAFRVNLLVFDEEYCRISHFNDENSFPVESDSAYRSEENYMRPLKSFRDLQEKVKDLKWELQHLTGMEQKDVPDSIKRHLQDGTLGELEEKVRITFLTEELRYSEDPLLSILFDACGSFILQRGDVMLYFLDALTELEEVQQKLLAVVMEERRLSELMKLVKDILKQTSKSEPKPFPLMDDSVTHMLVRTCDPEYKEKLCVTWDSDTCHSLCVLYTALSLLMVI
ncbi:LOW QUALITY PROTEIN: gasdermin-B [Dromiciops gliroides]|uniref:LOW QUALITY PROTEIN: gasdermin-B n=1 Tax=Dromiciops gliroides TaxID=33562 RepID=UPI001CC37248|nr:LOW QUALITY PROTEIN: gasdermin-B [Dromiciops gliroides]